MLEKFKDIHLFKDVPEYFLAGLETECNEVNLSAGEYLFRQGDVGKGMYIIIEGQVQILLHTEDEGDKVITELGPGNPFGEVSLLEKNTRIASAKAKENCKLLYLDIKKFKDFIDNNDPNALRISHNISLMLVDRLERANKLLGDLSKRTVQQDPKLGEAKSGKTEREVAKFKAKLLNEGLF